MMNNTPPPLTHKHRIHTHSTYTPQPGLSHDRDWTPEREDYSLADAHYRVAPREPHVVILGVEVAGQKADHDLQLSCYL